MPGGCQNSKLFSVRVRKTPETAQLSVLITVSAKLFSFSHERDSVLLCILVDLLQARGRT